MKGKAWIQEYERRLIPRDEHGNIAPGYTPKPTRAVLLMLEIYKAVELGNGTQGGDPLTWDVLWADATMIHELSGKPSVPAAVVPHC